MMWQKEVYCPYCNKVFYLDLNDGRYLSAKTTSCLYCKKRIKLPSLIQNKENEGDK